MVRLPQAVTKHLARAQEISADRQYQKCGGNRRSPASGNLRASKGPTTWCKRAVSQGNPSRVGEREAMSIESIPRSIAYDPTPFCPKAVVITLYQQTITTPQKKPFRNGKR